MEIESCIMSSGDPQVSSLRSTIWTSAGCDGWHGDDRTEIQGVKAARRVLAASH
jgi:hypothetical protein